MMVDPNLPFAYLQFPDPTLPAYLEFNLPRWRCHLPFYFPRRWSFDYLLYWGGGQAQALEPRNFSMPCLGLQTQPC